VQGRCTLSVPGECEWVVGSVLKECGDGVVVRVSAVDVGRYEVQLRRERRQVYLTPMCRSWRQ